MITMSLVSSPAAWNILHSLIADNYELNNNREFIKQYMLATNYLIDVDGHIIGYVSHAKEYLADIYIKEEYRNKKIATQCLLTLMEENPLSLLHVSLSNTNAIKMYKSLGFKYKTMCFDFYGTNFHAAVMIKE